MTWFLSLIMKFITVDDPKDDPDHDVLVKYAELERRRGLRGS